MNHTIRTPKGTAFIENYSIKKAVKAFCTERMGWDSHPDDCASTMCPIYPFRGKSRLHLPKREMSEEQKAAGAERLRLYREKRTTEAVQNGQTP